MTDLLAITLRDLLNPEFYIKLGGLWVLLFIVFAETGLMFGFFLPGDSLLLVNVNLCESDPIRFGVFRREGLVSRSNGFAWATPVRIDCLILAIVIRATRRIRGVQSATTMVEELSVLLNSAEEEILTVGDMLADKVEGLCERRGGRWSSRLIWRVRLLIANHRPLTSHQRADNLM